MHLSNAKRANDTAEERKNHSKDRRSKSHRAVNKKGQKLQPQQKELPEAEVQTTSASEQMAETDKPARPPCVPLAASSPVRVTLSMSSRSSCVLTANDPAQAQPAAGVRPANRGVYRLLPGALGSALRLPDMISVSLESSFGIRCKYGTR